MSPDRLAGTAALAPVAVGGAAGSTLRYLVGLWLPGLPGTLVANAVGSFLLGALLYGALHAGPVSGRTRSLVATGFLGSFTTYSAFALETALAPAPALVMGNVVGTYALGFAGVLAGRRLARWLAGRAVQ